MSEIDECPRCGCGTFVPIEAQRFNCGFVLAGATVVAPCRDGLFRRVLRFLRAKT